MEPRSSSSTGYPDERFLPTGEPAGPGEASDDGAPFREPLKRRDLTGDHICLQADFQEANETQASARTWEGLAQLCFWKILQSKIIYIFSLKKTTEIL